MRCPLKSSTAHTCQPSAHQGFRPKGVPSRLGLRVLHPCLIYRNDPRSSLPPQVRLGMQIPDPRSNAQMAHNELSCHGQLGLIMLDPNKKNPTNRPATHTLNGVRLIFMYGRRKSRPSLQAKCSPEYGPAPRGPRMKFQRTLAKRIRIPACTSQGIPGIRPSPGCGCIGFTNMFSPLLQMLSSIDRLQDSSGYISFRCRNNLEYHDTDQNK